PLANRSRAWPDGTRRVLCWRNRVPLFAKEQTAVKAHRITALAFVLLLGASGATVADGLRPAPAGVPSLADKHRVHQPFRGERFARTELFFGSARAGRDATEAELKKSLHALLTRRL